MLKYILRRMLVLPVIMFLVTAILFLFILRIPTEQRAQVYMPSGNPHKTEEQYQKVLAATIERYGLDQPFPVQYVKWVRNLFQGDWGWSPTSREPVLEGLLRRAPATLELTLAAMIPSVIAAIVLGSLAARRYTGLEDHLVRATAFVGWAFPPFILALILMNVFYAWLGWFPPERMSVWASLFTKAGDFRTYTGMLTIDSLLNGNMDLFWDAVRHLVLPAFTLAIAEWALLTRVMRSSLLDVLRQDHITTARAKGVPEPAVIARHARRNAILPVISTGGVVTSMLITGVVVVEVVFHYNGIGAWAVDAILSYDIPVAVGFALFSCGATVLASLIADILYAVADPRVRLF